MKSMFLKSMAIIIAIIGLISIFKYQAIYNKIIAPPFNYLQSQEVATDTIFLTIALDDFETLMRKKEEALKNGALLRTKDDYVPAELTYNGKNKRSKVRLKGDQLDHVDGDRWSLKVNMKSKDRLDGMKKFAIQDPKTRNFISEWIFHQLLDYEGLLSLEYRFLNVVINKQFKGIYALEEHPDQNYLSKRGIDSAFVFRFDEDEYWNKRKENESNLKLYDDRMFLSAPIESLSKFQKNDSAIQKQFEICSNKIIKWKSGQASLEEVFDIKELARFLAVVQVCRAYHAFRWNNIRFVYNIQTGKISPIGHDGDAGFTCDDLIIDNKSVIFKAQSDLFFSNPLLVDEFKKELERMSDKDYLDNFFAEINPNLQKNLNLLYQNDYKYVFEKYVYYNNIEFIQEELSKSRK